MARVVFRANLVNALQQLPDLSLQGLIPILIFRRNTCGADDTGLTERLSEKQKETTEKMNVRNWGFFMDYIGNLLLI